MKELSSISAREMVTLWWKERWVRVIVLSLLPIGVIDTAYTIAMASLYGVEIEFNPITRELLNLGLWLPWAALNIIGFTFFCMMAGSYYLHSRWRPGGPDTFWFSFIIALRIGMASYNVTFYYLPFVVTVYPPFWAGFFTFTVSLYIMNKLLMRRHDLSWSQAKYYVRSRYDSYKDAKMISQVSQNPDAPLENPQVQTEAVQKEIARDLAGGELKWYKGPWPKRAAYLFGAGFSYVLMGLAIEIISHASGLSEWSQAHGPFFILNEVTGPPIMASFMAIIFFMSLSLYFILKAFSTSQELLV